jgi:hypothetical protein
MPKVGEVIPPAKEPAKKMPTDGKDKDKGQTSVEPPAGVTAPVAPPAAIPVVTPEVVAPPTTPAVPAVPPADADRKDPF